MSQIKSFWRFRMFGLGIYISPLVKKQDQSPLHIALQNH